MPATKRKAPNSTASDGASSRTTRSKQAKTDGASSPESKPKSTPSKPKPKRGPKHAIPTSSFKAKAMPLHVNITHTPPPIVDENEVSVAAADPGFIGASTLVVSEFSTGSYGWKGSKRVTIELPGAEGEEKEKVQVMITINATVVGSKNQEEGEKNGDADAEAKKDAAEETAEEDEDKDDN
ncbi:hypothetical protein BDV98DRAFT_558518 [Pterulicium gracile]|uniref:Uncharacterized protein n=1 Tax=Pterulicium gracile TaxID=1884261 RepID=A0A5C3R4P8_9AGAR|nr:hypothetical protein BDV98DRAFT_558518 [Pterula gracilis]